MHFIKQSTAVKVRVGPIVSVSDAFTRVTTLALGAADNAELLKHDGAATVDISSNTFAAVTSANGYYDLSLSTTDTNTLGMMTIDIQDESLILPWKGDYMVIPSQIYDSLIAGTDKIDANVAQWIGENIPPTSGTGVPKVDIARILGNVPPTPTEGGVPVVDLRSISGTLVDVNTAQLGVNAVAISGSSLAADLLEEGAESIVSGTVGSGSTVTSVTTDLTSLGAIVTDQFKDSIITFKKDTTTASLRGQKQKISASTAAGVLTVPGLTTAPVSGDTFIIT